MKTIKYVLVSLVLIFSWATVTMAQELKWPRERTENGSTLITYQPQVDNWKDFLELDWRMAISFTPKGGKPVVGAVVLKGQTQVDDENKMVLITNLKVVRTHFPSLDPAIAGQMEQLLRPFLTQSVTITLHQLVASVPKKESMPGVQLNNDPPLIFVSYKTAILLDVDGQPFRVPSKREVSSGTSEQWS